MSRTVDQLDHRCVRCGYDLQGSQPDAQDRCPECGAASAGSRRAVDQAAWLLVPTLRLLIWGLPALLAAVCIARYIERARGLGQAEAILDSEAVLLYALPLLACIVGAGLLFAGAPGERRWRTLTIILAGLTLAAACLALADHGRLQPFWIGVTTTGAISYGSSASIGSVAAHAAILGAAAMAGACVLTLGRLGADLGLEWLRTWRLHLAAGTGLALLVALASNKVTQVLWAFRQHAWMTAGKPGPAPGNSLRTWLDPVTLALALVAVVLVWALAFTVLARLRGLHGAGEGPER